MTPESRRENLHDVRRMLARTKPEQTRRLLAGIMRTAPVKKDAQQYDA